MARVSTVYLPNIANFLGRELGLLRGKVMQETGVDLEHGIKSIPLHIHLRVSQTIRRRIPLGNNGIS